MSDAITILFYLFLDKSVTTPLDALDINDSSDIDISDTISLLKYLFLGSLPPAPPFPAPGYDPTPVDPYGGGDADEYDLLILTPEEFKESLSPLVDHKNSIGISCVAVTLAEIYRDGEFAQGRDEPEKIKLAIHSLHQRFQVKYVLLVGDVDKFPVRYARSWDSIFYGHGYYPTDLYYADLYHMQTGDPWDVGLTGFCDWDHNENGYIGEFGAVDHVAENWLELNWDFADLRPDVAVGRIPVSNETELHRMVEKIKTYETSISRFWIKKLLLVTGDFSNPYPTADEISTDMTSLGYSCTLRDHEVEWPQIPDIADRADLLASDLNSGYGFVVHLGHGGPTEWSGWCRKIDLGGFGNTEKLPIILSAGCSTAMFHFEEKYYEKKLGGKYSEYICVPEDEERFTGDATFEMVHDPDDPPDSVRLKAINITPESCLLQMNNEVKVVQGRGDVFAVTEPALSPGALCQYWRSIQSYNYAERSVRHRFYQGEITPIVSDLDRQDATFRLTPGLVDETDGELVSFESWNLPGFFLAEENRRVYLRQRRTCSEAFNESATFRITPGLADRSAMSFESYTRRGHYIRHWNFQLFVDPEEGGIFDQDATFRITDPRYDPIPHYCSLQLADSDRYLLYEIKGLDVVGNVRRVMSTSDEIAATFRKLPGLARPTDPQCVSYEALLPPSGEDVSPVRSSSQRYLRHSDFKIKVSPRRPLNLRDLPEPAAVQPASVDHDSIMESFLVKFNWGAVAYIGSYTGTQAVAYDVVRQFFEEFQAREGSATLGDVWRGELDRTITEQFPAIESLWGNWMAGAIFQHVHKMMLFGDPSLQIGGATRF